MPLGPPPLETLAGFDEPTLPQPSPLAGSMFDPAHAARQPSLTGPSEIPGIEQTAFSRLWVQARRLPYRVRSDYENFYNWPGLQNLALGVAVAGVLANTSADQGFRDWYQGRVHTSDLTTIGSYCKWLGEGEIVIPAFAGLAVVGAMTDNTPAGGFLAEFAGRTTRGYLVGLPPLVLGQALLGSSRPGPDGDRSHWHPFQADNGISGHAFVGAVPFITAAKLTDNVWVKGGLYGLSTVTGWSRIEHDQHYLSQVLLGWWMAYLACTAVDKPLDLEKPYALAPFVTPEGVGVNVVFRL